MARRTIGDIEKIWTNVEGVKKLSDRTVGIGPFVVGPAIERKIGTAAFSGLALDADWRDAAWCAEHGLYTRVADNVQALDQVGLTSLASDQSGVFPETELV